MNEKRGVSLIRFTLITFGFSYGLWAFCIALQQIGTFPAELNNTLGMIFTLIGGFGPPVAAYFTLRKADSDYNFKIYIKEAFRVKQKLTYYLLAVTMIALFFIVPALIGGLDAVAPGVETNLGISGRVPLYVTIPGILMYFIMGGQEELGWRGVLHPALQKKFTFIPATLITAVAWALWHLPLWFMDGTGQSEVDFWRFLVKCIGFSFALGAVRSVTGSVFLCLLMHASYNSLYGSFPVKDELWLMVTIALVLFVASVVIVAADNNKKKRKEVDRKRITDKADVR